MKKTILFAVNYYTPYISGLTEFARLLAEELAREGYRVKVITARHDKSLPRREIIHGVLVERCSVQLKISKGTVSIPFLYRVIREARKYDVVNLHLPMLEAGLLSLFIKKEKIMPLYQCDVNLPKGLLNDLIVQVMDLSHKICFWRSQKIWVTSVDYALHSRAVSRYRKKFVEVGGTIKKIQPGNYVREGRYKIGFCGRIVEEKGIDVLLRAFERLQQQGIDAELLIAGDYKNVAGGSVYPKLARYIKKHRVKHVQFLGCLPEEELGAFYSALDVFVLPSVNSLEAFGLVQVEAMMCGTPVVASDLYGVRTIVQRTGMGLVSRAGDAKHLAECLREVLADRKRFVKEPAEISRIFSTKAFISSIYDCIHFEAAKADRGRKWKA
ncbi:MAG: glycosyltransferase [Eubacterium sp.]|nr:glycosyltransferase [Eubacterium sp.]